MLRAMHRTAPNFPSRRTIIHAEALGWLASNTAVSGTSVITSLPDVSEIPNLGFAGWREWFIDTARRLMLWVPADGTAIFFQSDIRFEDVWVDKGYMIMEAARAAEASLVWHKIVCRKPPGTISLGRPSYSHMLCFSPVVRPTPQRPGPDVIADAGHMPWPRAMGENACRVACRFLRDETATRVVVDPFCGEGSVLAMANAYGFEAIGIDRSGKRCRAALSQNPQEL